MCAKWAYKNPCMAAQLPLYVCVCERVFKYIFMNTKIPTAAAGKWEREGGSCHCNDSNQSVQHLASSSGAAAGANFDCTKHLHARTCSCCCCFCWPCQTVQFALLVHKLCTIDGNCCAWSRVRLQLRLWASVSHWPQYKLHIEIHFNTIQYTIDALCVAH